MYQINTHCFYLFFSGFLHHHDFYFMHCTVPLAPAHLLQVAHLPTSGTCLPIYWALLGHMDPTTVSAQPSVRCCVYCLSSLAVFLVFEPFYSVKLVQFCDIIQYGCLCPLHLNSLGLCQYTLTGHLLIIAFGC